MNVINSHTKVSEIIKMNREAIEALASINPHFEKLRNPLLRKILAPRVNLAEAAKIGGASIEVFYQKLIPLGFCVEANEISKTENNVAHNTNENLDVDCAEYFDVRPILHAKQDPFREIMDKLKQLKAGQSLCVINSFQPIPLMRILQEKGYGVKSVEKNKNLFYTWFSHAQNDLKPDLSINEEAKNSFEEVLEQFRNKLTYLNVRGLEMPLPMVKILEALEKLPSNQALFVYHQRIPQYLLPQLKDKGYQWTINPFTMDEPEIIIYKK